MTTDVADGDSALDGLPGDYERSVTETDPPDADSHLGLTAASEADNGLPDGSEDSDGDGLPAQLEYALGTSRDAVDTDGGGIDDGVEVGSETVDQQGFTLYQINSDPTDPNTDDGGAPDGTEYSVGSDPTQ